MPNQTTLAVLSRETQSTPRVRVVDPRLRLYLNAQTTASWLVIRARSAWRNTNNSKPSSSSNNSNNSCPRWIRSTPTVVNNSSLRKKVPTVREAQTMTKVIQRRLSKACLYNKWTISTLIANWIWQRKVRIQMQIMWSKIHLPMDIKAHSIHRWIP